MNRPDTSRGRGPGPAPGRTGPSTGGAERAVPISARGVRKPYRSPRLATYGRLTDVTRFGGSQIVDSGSGLGQAPG